MKKINASALLATFTTISVIASSAVSFGTTLSTVPVVVSNERLNNLFFNTHTIYLTPSVNITPGQVITFSLPNLKSNIGAYIHYEDKNGNEKRACEYMGNFYFINNTTFVKFTTCNLEAGKTYYFNIDQISPLSPIANRKSYTYTISYSSNVPGDTPSSAVIAYTEPQFGISVDKISYKEQEHYAKITLSREDFARIYHYDYDTAGFFKIEMKDLPASASKYVIITNESGLPTPPSGTVDNGKFVGSFSSTYSGDPEIQKIYVYLYYRGSVVPLNNAKISVWSNGTPSKKYRIYYLRNVPLLTAEQYKITPPSGLSLITKTSSSNITNINNPERNSNTSTLYQPNNIVTSPLDKIHSIIDNARNAIQSGKSVINSLKNLF